MRHTRWEYKLSCWKPRALAFARSLKGRARTQEEQQIFDKCGREGCFRVFGIQPETQGYIDYTIEMLEELDPADPGLLPIAEIRLKWTMQELKKLKGVKE